MLKKPFQAWLLLNSDSSENISLAVSLDSLSILAWDRLGISVFNKTKVDTQWLTCYSAVCMYSRDCCNEDIAWSNALAAKCSLVISMLVLFQHLFFRGSQNAIINHSLFGLISARYGHGTDFQAKENHRNCWFWISLPHGSTLAASSVQHRAYIVYKRCIRVSEIFKMT